MTLEDTLADLRERVTMLRVEGHPVQAASVERAIGDRDIRMADRYLRPRADVIRETFEDMDRAEGP